MIHRSRDDVQQQLSDEAQALSDVTSEEALAGIVLLRGTVPNIDANDFHSPRIRTLWSVFGILEARGREISIGNVEDELRKLGKLEAVGGLGFLSKLVAESPHSARTESLCRDVSEAHRKRTALLAISDYLQRGELSTLVSKLQDLDNEPSKHTISLQEASQKEIARIKDHLDGGGGSTISLPTGYSIDQILPGGIPLGQVTLIFGETGNFKTTLKDNIIDNLIGQGHGVLNFTLEDSAELTACTYLSRKSGIPYKKILRGDVGPSDLLRLRDGLDDTNGALISADVPPAIDDAIILARQARREIPLRAVFIDYVQLMDFGRLEERHGLADIVKKAQRAAKQDNVAYVLISQMNERNKNRDDPRPKLEDMFGSRFLSHGCKCAIGLFRPWLYDKDPQDLYGELARNHPSGNSLYAGLLELHVVKNRLGETGVHKTVYCDLPTGRIVDFDL